MSRLTRLANSDNESYIIDGDKVEQTDSGYSGEAVNKLAKYENLCDDIAASQIEISKELEKLRNEGKMNSVKFKELMTKKLINNNVIVLLKTYGLQ